MAKIQGLRPNVSREEAIRHFTEGVLSHAVGLFRGPVRSIAELYVPFRRYEVKVFSGGRSESQIFALDAVRGVLDLYQFPSSVIDSELLTLDTRNVLPIGLDAAQAASLLTSRVRRLIFSRGFFKVRNLRIEATPIPGEICVPYWVCFRGENEHAQLSVLDAVRRRPEGAKVRRLIEEWLRTEMTDIAPTREAPITIQQDTRR